MENAENLLSNKHQELNDIAEFIKNPDIEERKKAARKLARLAFKAIESDESSKQLSDLIKSAASEKHNDSSDIPPYEEKYRATLSAIPDVLFYFDNKGAFLDCQTSDLTSLPMERETFIGKTLDDVLPASVAEQGLIAITTAINTKKLQVFEYDFDTAEGKQFYEMRVIKLVSDDCLGISRNITERKQLEEKLTKLSLIDSLTGLYSRNHLEEQLKILKHSRKYPISIINVDIDNLRIANNVWGHSAGDELLRKTGTVLRDVFRQDDCVARAGGDEFVILLPEIDEKAAKKTIDRIRESLKKHNLKETDFPLSLSIGSATAKSIVAWDKALKEADKRMYEEKNMKKSKQQ